jgi:hypothetical protein
METRNIKYFQEYYKDLNNGKLAAKNSLYTHYSSRKSKKTTSKKFKDISEFIDSNSSILLNKRTGWFKYNFLINNSFFELLKEKFNLKGKFSINSNLLDELNLKILENKTCNNFAGCEYLKRIGVIQFKIRKKNSKLCTNLKNEINKAKPIHFLDIKIKTTSSIVSNI